MEEMAVPEGYRFRPNKYEAINYLRRRVNQQPQPCNLVKEMDVYDIRHPSELFRGTKDRELFCFTTLKPSQTCASRSRRKTLGGTWKEQGSISIDRGAPAVTIGLKTSFGFLFKNGGKEERHRYIMHQYSLPATEKCRVVFCKIRVEDKKIGRSSCYRRNEEVILEQQQQGKSYEEEQQVVQAVSGSSSSSFVEGGGPSSSTSFHPAGHQDTTMSKNYSFAVQQQNQESMTNYYLAAAASSSSECMMTTNNNYEVEGSAGQFSADVRDTTTTNYFVNNIHNTVKFPGKYYYSEEQQQQQYMNMMMMNPSPSSAPECMNYHNYKNNDEFQGGWSSYFIGNPRSPVLSAVVQQRTTIEGYSSSEQQQQQYMMMNPSSSSASDRTNNFSNNNNEELGGGSSFLVGDPSSLIPVFSNNNNLDDDQHAKGLLPMQHLHIDSPPPLQEISESTNQHHHHQHAPQPQSDQQLQVLGEDTLSRWIMAQSEE